MRSGWIALVAVISFTAVAACGGPVVTDLGTGGTNSPGSSGTPGGSPTPTGGTSGTPTPGAMPTITNVPSYATWNTSVKPLLSCSQCHSGGSGGLTMTPGSTDPITLKGEWFDSFCNRNFNNNLAGTQSYSPPAGRIKNYLSGQTANGLVGLANNGAAVTTWLQQGGATTPPPCTDKYNYDLLNSQ